MYTNCRLILLSSTVCSPLLYLMLTKIRINITFLLNFINAQKSLNRSYFLYVEQKRCVELKLVGKRAASLIHLKKVGGFIVK